MVKFCGLLLVKSDSKRLPGKNIMDFKGKPMFVWNLEKCLKIFPEVYVSSDSEEILEIAEKNGAIGILRGKELCGDTPNIPVYQHALRRMRKSDGIVAVHANNPTIEIGTIETVKKCLEMGAEEVMTCHPIQHHDSYKEQGSKIYGSVWGLSTKRLKEYTDPFKPNPDIWIVDKSREVETIIDYNYLNER